MILFIDNYDSFTYNLVDLFGQYQPDLRVVRNDAISLEQIEEIGPAGIVISPGPGTPDEAGICPDVIRKFYQRIPIFGVCLGHQCMAQVFGAKITRAQEPVHGKTAAIFHKQKDVFDRVPFPFDATRYHSLIIERESLPSCFEITAETEDGIIMGIRHKMYPLSGVQFHPESILTTEGPRIIKNWLNLVEDFSNRLNSRAV